MRKPFTVIIITLSVVCTLKDILRQSIQRIKAMLLCIVHGSLVCWHCWYEDQSTQCIECCLSRLSIHCTGVCGSYTTLYAENYEVWKLYSTLYKVASHSSKGEATVLCLLSCRFSCSPVWGGIFVNFLGLVNYKGNYRQDAQPIPNS